jgi:uncharacterized protein YhbP (UPF0306 family)
VSGAAGVDPAALRAAITALLAREATLTLATVGADGKPWAATVFFAADDALALYFVTDPRTRHGRDLAADARVAGTVQPAVRTWDDVLGVQLEGRARVLEGAEREHALACYLAKFPDVARLFAAPRNDGERLIGERLRKTAFWGLAPDFLRLVDNGRGFGWKGELRLAPAAG